MLVLLLPPNTYMCELGQHLASLLDWCGEHVRGCRRTNQFENESLQKPGLKSTNCYSYSREDIYTNTSWCNFVTSPWTLLQNHHNPGIASSRTSCLNKSDVSIAVFRTEGMLLPPHTPPFPASPPFLSRVLHFLSKSCPAL